MQYFPCIIHKLDSFKIPMHPIYILHIPSFTFLDPIATVALDSALEMGKTGLLKMREGREKFKFEEALIGPGGHVPGALSGFDPSSPNPADSSQGADKCNFLVGMEGGG